jgi:hypothetical protein
MKDNLESIIEDEDLLKFRKDIQTLVEESGFDMGIRVQVQFWGQYEGPNYPPVITVLDEIEEPVCEYCHEKTYYNEMIKGEWVFICPSCLGKREKKVS